MNLSVLLLQVHSFTINSYEDKLASASTLLLLLLFNRSLLNPVSFICLILSLLKLNDKLISVRLNGSTPFNPKYRIITLASLLERVFSML